MHRVDYEELEIALAYLTGALPCRAKAVTLLTLDGELVAQFLRHHDAARIAALLVRVTDTEARLADAMEHGELRYSVTAGADGATLTLVLGDAYLLSISAVNVKSLDEMLRGAREGLAPLLGVLGLRAS